MQTPVAFPRSRTVTARAGTGWAGPTNTPVLLELNAFASGGFPPYHR